jgi:hypothetical protein
MRMREYCGDVWNLAKLIMLGMFVQLMVILYVFFSGYFDRVDLVDSQRAGCERGKLDRIANAQGWRIAQDARIASGDYVVAHRYGTLARDLEARSKIDCRDVYPDARLIP